MASNNDALIIQSLGEIKQANISIAGSMEAIRDNLKILNDNNVLHNNCVENEYKTITYKLQELTTKYWWLIIALLCALLAVLGYKEAVTFF